MTILPTLEPASVSPALLPWTKPITSPSSCTVFLQPQTLSHLLSIPPLAIQFGACLPRIIHKIWEANSIDNRVYLSKCDISDTFHRCNFCPVYVGTFSYIIAPLPKDPHPLLCIDLFLYMGWVNSPDVFYFASETDVALANEYIKDTNTHVPTYSPTVFIYCASPSPTVSSHCL